VGGEKMNIVLISPNYLLREEFGDPSDPPIGLASIGATLLKHGYNVKIIDANTENLTIDDVLSCLIDVRPDMVGISCNYSPLHNPTLQIAERVKKELNCPVIVGGNHATALSRHLLKCTPYIDVVVRGEGEWILPELLKAMEKRISFGNVRGITFREGEDIVETPDAPLISDLDQIPMPAYHLLPMKKYKRYNIVTSRGCPFNCSYCASKIIFKHKVRYRSHKLVANEIKYLFQNYGKKHLWFSDDTFISNPDYTYLLTDELIKINLDMTWSCLTRVDTVTRELLRKMKISGCSYISYGIESGNQEILNEMGKKITVDVILTTLETTYEVGIKQYGFFIVGFPGETWKTIMDSYKLIYQSKLDGAAFNILIPLPGTKLFNKLVDENMLSLDEIRWDYLFARSMKETYESYSAELSARWTQLSGSELIDACRIGHKLPEIFKYLSNNRKE
jgi:anaerobic magnesium-protoporphyrin IX monomethyl ester cyclase